MIIISKDNSICFSVIFNSYKILERFANVNNPKMTFVYLNSRLSRVERKVLSGSWVSSLGLYGSFGSD